MCIGCILLYSPPQSMLVSQLWKRYQKRLIYTYVGDILVSINPFQKLDIYNEKVCGIEREQVWYYIEPRSSSMAFFCSGRIFVNTCTHCSTPRSTAQLIEDTFLHTYLPWLPQPTRPWCGKTKTTAALFLVCNA